MMNQLKRPGIIIIGDLCYRYKGSNRMKIVFSVSLLEGEFSGEIAYSAATVLIRLSLPHCN